MVNFKNIADKAKQAVDKRGGTDSLKADASELKDIAKGPGSLTDKAKAAAAAIKDPGADAKAETPPGSPETPTAPPPGDAKTPKRAAGKAKTDAAEKAGRKAHHRHKPEEVGGAK